MHYKGGLMVNLSPKQEKIVFYDGDKPLSVEAGPGAGKTRVIIERVKYLLNEKKVAPESMLVITFTRKAADELKERLSKDDIAKSDIDLMQISTIHGFCSRVLQESGAIGFDIIDDDLNEKNNMFISKHLKDLGHRKIAFIGEPLTILKFEYFKKAMQQNSLFLDERNVVTVESRFENLHRLLFSERG